MIQIKKFIDRVSSADSRKQTTVVLNIEDANTVVEAMQVRERLLLRAPIHKQI